MKFEHRKNPVLKNAHIIEGGNICLHLYEAAFETDEEMNEAIAFILSKLNS